MRKGFAVSFLPSCSILAFSTLLGTSVARRSASFFISFLACRLRVALTLQPLPSLMLSA